VKRLVKCAAAATILIALVGPAVWLVPRQRSALAFEKIAEAVANIRSATCKITIERNEGKTAVAGEVVFLAPSRERREILGPGGRYIVIHHPAQGKCLSLVPGQKLAIFSRIENIPADQRINSFERMRKLVSDAQGGAVDEIKELGRQTIDGCQAVGFRKRLPPPLSPHSH